MAMSGVLRVTVPIVLQRNSEGFWLEFKGGGKEALVNLGNISQALIVAEATMAWANESLTQALLSKRRVIGLKDKLGVPVHEGDIVQYTPAEGTPSKGVIKWQAASAGFVIHGNSFVTSNLSKVSEWEVIGNIFQTPELL
jgi:hypothetical protein